MQGAVALVLGSDDNYVKFSKLLAKAESEGRIDGKFRCPTCGMRFKIDAEAANCCAQVARSA